MRCRRKPRGGKGRLFIEKDVCIREPALFKPAFFKASCAFPRASESFCGKQRLKMSPTTLAAWPCGEATVFLPSLCTAEVSESWCFAGSALWPLC